VENHHRAEVPERALILVIERDPHMMALERYFLEGAGFRVEFVDDGERGLEVARRLVPAIVVAEILLPRLDGLSVCRRLKGDEATRAIPVLLFSILAAADRARDAGADAFLQKPLDDAALISTVAQLLAKPAERRLPA
jgi:CheY-like chemotaxis protein